MLGLWQRWILNNSWLGSNPYSRHRSTGLAAKTLGDDVRSAEVLIKVDNEEPSRWVWETDEMVPNNVEEWSGIDNENYVVVSEEHVVDGVANFMARCIMSNPESQVHTFLPFWGEKNSGTWLLNLTSHQVYHFVSNLICFLANEEFDTGRATKNCGESFRWCQQIGKDYWYLACWETVLCAVHLGTCSCRVV